MQYEGKRLQPNFLLRSDDPIITQLKRFKSYLSTELRLDIKTIQEHYHLIEAYALAYFAHHGMHNDPRRWHTESIGMGGLA